MATAKVGSLLAELRLNSAQFISETKKVNRSLGGMQKQFASFSRVLKASVGVGISAATIRSVTRYADTWTTVQNRLRIVTKDTRELKTVQAELLRVAQDTRSDLTDTVELYSRVARSVDQLGKSQKEVIEFTRTVNQAIQASGSTSQEAAAGVIQLAQGLASGALRGDELRSVLEQMPRLARAIADGMGITVGQLRELGKEGKLTAQAVFDAVQGQADVVAQEFGKVTATTSQALAVIENSTIAIIGQFDEATGLTAGFARQLQELSTRADGSASSVTEVGLALHAFVKIMRATVDVADELDVGLAVVERGMGRIAESAGELFTSLGDRFNDGLLRDLGNIYTNMGQAAQDDAASALREFDAQMQKIVDELVARREKLLSDINTPSDLTGRAQGGNRAAADEAAKKTTEYQEKLKKRADRVLQEIRDPTEVLRDRISDLAELLRNDKITWEQYGKAAAMAAETANKGWAALEEDMSDATKEMRSSIESWGRNAEDVFVGFTQTGKFAFKDLANSIVADMARIAVRQAIIQPLMTSVLGAIGIPGNATGGSFAVGNAGKLPGFQFGGSFQVGGFGGTDSQLVAFRASPGETVSIDRPGAGASSGPVNITFNVNSLDPTDAAGVIIRNSAVIKGVVKQGVERAGGSLAMV